MKKESLLTPQWGVYIITLVKSIDQRLNNIIGQTNGVKRMISENEDCLKVLTQLKAIKVAIEKVMDTVVEGQLDSCLSKLGQKDKETLLKLKKYVKSN